MEVKIMGYENSTDRARLGYGLLDMQVGDWLTSNDVASFTYVRHPEQDNKFHVRELLMLFGKRFPNVEAEAIWREIENYREGLANTFGPPGCAVGRVSFEQAARAWYKIDGSRFEKDWCLHSPTNLNYARTGTERVVGRWLRQLHPDLGDFIEAGFSFWTIVVTVHSPQFEGWIKSLWRLKHGSQVVQNLFWVRLAAYLLRFSLNKAQVEQAVIEVAEHANRLQTVRGQPVRTSEAALDYFRRLELGGLGPEVIRNF